MSNQSYEHRNNFSAWIVRRARGVYLVKVQEYESGVEEWDAFPTLAGAKWWARDWTGIPRSISWKIDDMSHTLSATLVEKRSNTGYDYEVEDQRWEKEDE